MNEIKPIFALMLVAFLSIAAYAQPGSIDKFIRSEIQKHHIPGVSLVVIKNNKIVKATNYGLANVELKVPVTGKTSFEIASMTKQFTAAAILLLVQDGKIKLDDRVSKYLEGLPQSWADTKVRQLLDHTSGLRDDWDDTNNFFLTKTSDADFLKALTERPLKFSPGERFAYSCGPFLAGVIVGKVSGMTYAEFMQKRIFDRLGMKSTHVIDAVRLVPDRASGYVYRDGRLGNGVRISPAAHARGDVGIRTTALDLAKWDAALNGTQLLMKASLDEMFEFAKLSDGSPVPHGLGWFLNPMRGHAVMQHGGGFRTGFNTTINRYPEDGLTVILLTNLFRAGANDLGHMIAGFYNPNFRSLSARPPVNDPDPKRTSSLRTVLSSLSEGKTDIETVAASFPYRFYEKSDWESLSKNQKSLKFIGCDDISSRKLNMFGQLAFQICYYSVADSFVSFIFDSKGSVLYAEPYEY